MSTSESSTQTEHAYTADRLHLVDLPGDVEVAVGSSRDIRVRISGPARLVEGVDAQVSGNVLRLRGPAGPTNGVTVVNHRGGGSYVSMSSSGGVNVVSAGDMVMSQVAGGRVIVNGQVIDTSASGCGGGRLDVRIEVPTGTPVSIEDRTGGNYRLGDLRSDLDAQIMAGTVAAGQIASAQVTVTGHGQVDIAQASGRALRGSITGSGQVTVRDGDIEDLTLSISGSGRLTYGGTARRADLTITGSGQIRVNHITEHVHDRVTGSGRVHVHVPPRRSKDTFWS